MIEDEDIKNYLNKDFFEKLKDEPRKNILQDFSRIISNFIRDSRNDYQKTSALFEDWISSYITCPLFQETYDDIKLFNLLDLFNSQLKIEIESISIDIPSTSESVEKNIVLSTNFLEKLLRESIQNVKIYEFIQSEQWKELLKVYCEDKIKNCESINSLKKLISFSQLINKKIKKYNLKKGW